MTQHQAIWRPIDKCPNQTPVLVCNHTLLGWHAVAIQSALGEWWYEDGRGRLALPHEPTHWQELSSIQPLQAMFGKAGRA